MREQEAESRGRRGLVRAAPLLLGVLGLGATVLPAMEIAKVIYRRRMREIGTWPPPASVLSRKKKRRG